MAFNGPGEQKSAWTRWQLRIGRGNSRGPLGGSGRWPQLGKIASTSAEKAVLGPTIDSIDLKW
jgi:hypothetical protein